MDHKLPHEYRETNMMGSMLSSGTYGCLGNFTRPLEVDFWWNATMSKVADKGKARAGELHPILVNRQLDARIRSTVLKSGI